MVEGRKACLFFFPCHTHAGELPACRLADLRQESLHAVSQVSFPLVFFLIITNLPSIVL